MKIGAFDIVEPAPRLAAPHALMVITSWLDAGHAASLLLSRLEGYYGGQRLADLARPGDFFDFTRYRPTISRKGGSAEMDIPNARVTWGRIEGGNDFIFIRLPEPHALSEDYVDSVVSLLKHFGTARYGMLGSFYDMVPYTRPVMVSGGASNEILRQGLETAGVSPGDYEGPTSILSLVAQKTAALGIENFSLVAHLPGYITPEEDFRGLKRLSEAIQPFYDVSLTPEDLEHAREQDEQFKETAEQFLQQQPQLRLILKQLEDNYDARQSREKEETRLSPEVEKFLREMNRRFGQGS